MEQLSDWLPIILYVLGGVLLVVLIILIIRLNKTMKKVDALVEDSKKKVESLNGFFRALDSSADKLALLNDKMVNAVFGFVTKLFGKKKDVEEKEDIEDEPKKKKQKK